MITLLLLVRATYMYGVVLHAHPGRGASHNQRNTTGEVATTSPPFYNEPHRSHVLCVKAELGTTSTSWSQHHFVAIGNPERHMRKASHCGSKEQKSWHAMVTIIASSRHVYVWCCSSRTSRSWWITQSTQHHRRGCNSSNVDDATLRFCWYLSFVSWLVLWSGICLPVLLSFTFVLYVSRIGLYIDFYNWWTLNQWWRNLFQSGG